MNKKQKKVAVGVGVGLTALAAAAAGTYFFAGKRGAKNRAKVSKWAEAAKNDVLKQVKGLKTISANTYSQAVDAVMDRYKKAKKLDPKELVVLAAELKGHWNAIAKEVAAGSKKIKPLVVRTVKSVTKKSPTKKAGNKRASKKAAKKRS